MGNLRLLQKILIPMDLPLTRHSVALILDKYIVLSCTKALSSGLKFLRNIPAEFAPLWVLPEPPGLPTAKDRKPSRLLEEALGQRAPS